MPRLRGSMVLRGLLLTVLGLGAWLIARRVPVEPTLRALEEGTTHLGLWGPVVFGLVYAVAVLTMGPVSVLTMAAGALFGLLGGTLVASLAWALGATLAFLIARYLLRDLFTRRIRQSPRWTAIDQAVSQGGWPVVALLRLSPVIVNLQNYVFGLSRISLRTFVLTQWLASLPVTFLYVSLGHAGRISLQGARPLQNPAEWTNLVIGLLVTIVGVGCVTRRVRKKSGT